MSNERSVWLLGGPDAGKSNYLTRTWLAIRAQRGLLELAALPEEFEYLNSASGQLTSGDFVSHTSRGVHIQNAIPIRTRSISPELSGSLVIPDYSGEDWIAIHTARRWSSDWEKRLPTLAGCLLFLRASSPEVVAPIDWIGCHRAFGIAVEMEDAQPGETEFHSPTQVVVIDWLQCVHRAIRDLKLPVHRLRVGIVISAWDRVPGDQQNGTPSEYLRLTFPLLSQFIESNSSDFEFATFGASVAGADFKLAPGFKDEFLRGRATDFGYVIYEANGERVESRDHTLPIAWALGVGLPAAAPVENGS